MKSYSLVTGVILFLSFTLMSCTTPGKEKTFSSVYEGHVERLFTELNDFMKDSLFSFVGTEEDTLRFMLDMPSFGSGEMSAMLSSKMSGLSSESNISLTGYMMMMGDTLRVNEAKGALMSVSGDMYGRIDALDMTGSLAKSMDVTELKQYFGKWISFKTEDLMTGEVDMTAAKIQSNLYKVKLEDIKKYLLQYPIIRPVGSGGIDGKNYVYNVELDRENVAKFIVAMYEQLAETGATNEMKSDLAKGLSGMTLTGKLAVDSSDLLYFTFTGRLVGTDGTSLEIQQSYQRDGLRMTLSGEGMSLALSSLKTDGKNRSTLMTLTAQDTDIKLSLMNNDEYVTSMTGTFNAQGLNGTMEYMRANDGTFSGAIILPMNNTVMWNGKVDGGKLTAMSMNGKVSGGAMMMNLTEKDGWVTGPMTITSGEAQVVSGTVSLKSMKEEFGLRADVSIIDVPGVNHIEIDATMKQKKDSGVKVEAPKDSIPFNTVAESMGAYAYPAGGDMSGDAYMSGFVPEDLPIDEEMTPEQKAELEKIMKSMTGIAMPQ